MDFNISETIIKNTLVYRTFNKKNWDREAKECDYQYIN